ncbi:MULTISPECIES: hypothetical protein [unclassified Arcicella]|uniref:energy transducer TonB n=1 Tax=unclassified Arcicella TaxID=2644986 RepID=UPI002865FEE2|nr:MULTISPECIES: hypothetical protein [unclassified Arcicella]MDR6561738.1 outer membrane biosynthesis protein TonB [Arcicella sp. BE51]MDR6812518.1 outer membrane biosynthesis protein TonB [Arcicella sp. BE140]MDR6823710.1 outer membrane biosynthesis protein TonB [Arcicella sp. BE139]
MNSYQLEEEESKNRQRALIITIIINALMFYLFWYITVWTSEENKKEELVGDGGFVMNFGTDKSGSGKVYTKNKASDLKEEIESKASTETKKIEKVVPKPVIPPEVEKVKTVVKKAPKEPPVVSSKVTSPVKVKEEVITKVEKKVATKPAEVKPTPAPVKVPEKKIDNSALLPTKKGNSSSNGTSGTESRPGGASDGNSTGKGNQGQPEGKLVKDGNYVKGPVGDGNGGTGGSGSGGSSLNLTGWTWFSKPVVDDDSNDTGIIRFKIKVDSDGDVVDISLVESTVSPTVMQKYKRTVQKTKFRPTSDGDRPEYSSGTVTFKLSPR